MTAARLKLGAQAAAVGLVAALLALLVWKVVGTGESEVSAALAQGKPVPAPAFELPRLDGDGTVSLAQFRGRPLLVNFWASWCVPCEEEAPALQGAWDEHRDEGLVVVGVNYDDLRSDARAFVAEHGVTYPNGVDRGKRAVADYGLLAVPETFFVDRQGRIVGRIRGAVDNESNREEFERLLERILS